MTITKNFDVEAEDSCRNCRRPIQFVNVIGWLHCELPRYAHEPITCEWAHPVSCGSHHKGRCPEGWV